MNNKKLKSVLTPYKAIPYNITGEGSVMSHIFILFKDKSKFTLKPNINLIFTPDQVIAVPKTGIVISFLYSSIQCISVEYKK